MGINNKQQWLSIKVNTRLTRMGYTGEDAGNTGRRAQAGCGSGQPLITFVINVACMANHSSLTQLEREIHLLEIQKKVVLFLHPMIEMIFSISSL